jgi:hypothetical protein
LEFFFSSRLTVAYNKAKEYLTKITSGIEQQTDIWQYRQQIIRDQVVQMKPSSSYDFLLPKTQRINELTLEAVQGLNRKKNPIIGNLILFFFSIMSS